MKHLTPQQKLIVNYLADGDWHCMANANFYMKDDRTRISELQKKGYVIEGEPCRPDITRCGKNHSSKVYMRRIVAVPPPSPYEVFHELMQSQ